MKETSIFATKEDIRLLETKIAEAKIDMLKWFIPLFVTLMLMVVGLYFKK